MTEQLALPGPMKDNCACGCGLFGRPIANKANHVRECRCKPCLAGKNSRRGKANHRKIARDLGIAPKGFATSSEEAWTLPWARLEVKTGSQAKPSLTMYRNNRDQSEVSRPFGDGRPFASVTWTGLPGDPALITFTLDDHKRLMEAFYGG